MKLKSNRFSTVCANSCKQVMARLRSVKESIAREYSNTITAHNRLVQLALNEAEALAAQTSYPHLFFPVLAEEKVRAVRSWSKHQRAVRRSDLARWNA